MVITRLQTAYCINESDTSTEKPDWCEKGGINNSPPPPQQDLNTCAVCCFLHEASSLIRFSLITDSLSSFDAGLCSPSLSLLLSALPSPLFPFFPRHQRTKLKQGSASQLPWHALPFSLNQKSRPHCATDDPPAKSSSGFQSSLITLHLDARSYTLYVHWLFRFPLSDYLFFFSWLIKNNCGGNVLGSHNSVVKIRNLSCCAESAGLA